MHKRKKILLVILASLILILCGIWIYRKQVTAHFNSEKLEYWERKAPDIQLRLFGDQQQYILVEKQAKFLPNESKVYASTNYVLTSTFKLNDYKSSDPNHFEDGEFYTIYTYDLKNEFKKEEIDIAQVYKSFGLSGTIKATYPITYQGQDYIFMVLLIETKDELETSKTSTKFYLLSMDGKQVIEAPNEVYQNYKNNYSNDAFSDIYGYSNISLVLSNQFNLFSSTSFSTYYLEKRDPKKKVDLSGTHLSKDYPEVASALKDDGIVFTRSDFVSGEDWFNTLIHWLAPEDQEVLEIYVTDYDTKEKTSIASYSDFEVWKSNRESQ